MEVRLQYETVAKCHPADVWHLFCAIEEWRDWSGVFGHAGWVHGEPWCEGSRFIIEVLAPQRLDLEVVVAQATPKLEVVLLFHGAALAAQQWVRFLPHSADETLIQSELVFVGSGEVETPHFQQAFLQMIERWFDGLKAEAVKHCLLVAL